MQLSALIAGSLLLSQVAVSLHFELRGYNVGQVVPLTESLSRLHSMYKPLLSDGNIAESASQDVWGTKILAHQALFGVALTASEQPC